MNRSRTCTRWILLGTLTLLLTMLTGTASASRHNSRPSRPTSDHPSAQSLTSAVSRQDRPGRKGKGKSAPLAQLSDEAASLDILSSSALTATVPEVSTGLGAPGSGGASALILYDTAGDWGFLGELYATATANLASHFGSWRAEPVQAYQAGQIDQYTATIYIGSTYDEPLPEAFLDEAYATTKPVIWMYDNIWQMTNRFPDFQTKYGWMWSQFNTSPVSQIDYKGISLTRDGANNGAGIMDYGAVGDEVQTLATAVTADGSTFPWALRSGNLTYIGEVPFTYTSETDRLIAFEDILYDALAPTAATHHQALLRLEDISPHSNPADLKAVADYLYSQGVPFGFGVSPYYQDPLAAENATPTFTHLKDVPQIVSMIAYLQSHGGVLVEHGYTHQYSNIPNPYDGITNNDFEFYRVTEDASHDLTFVGPVPEDSTAWAKSRMDASRAEFVAAGLTAPQIFEFPHYSASAADYAAAAGGFQARWERALYFKGSLSGTSVDYNQVIGQMFPYVVRDIYGQTVLPENIGDYEPEPFYTFGVHLVSDILNGASKNLAIRDGFASVYYHPFLGTGPLSEIVEGLKAQGWTFTSPTIAGGISGADPVVPASTALPTVTGTALTGQTLTASPGTWNGNPTPAIGYSWSRCNTSGGSCSVISRATTKTYLLIAADLGHTIRVNVTASNTYGSATSQSVQTSLVASPIPSNTVLPAITGMARTGQTMATDAGTWSGAQPISYTYSWLRCNASGNSCSTISGATAQTHLLVTSDQGHTIRVKVTARNGNGSATVQSAQTQVVVAPVPINTDLPVVTGTARVGQTLTTTTGTWDGAISYTYQWARCNTSGNRCSNISRATSKTYLLTRTDADSTIRVIVTAKNSYDSTDAQSVQTGVIGR